MCDGVFFGNARCVTGQRRIDAKGDVRGGHTKGCSASAAQTDFFLSGEGHCDFTSVLAFIFEHLPNGFDAQPASNAVV